VAGLVVIVIAGLCVVAGGISIWLKRIARRQQKANFEADGYKQGEYSLANEKWTMKDLEGAEKLSEKFSETPDLMFVAVALSGDGVLDEDETNSAWMSELTTKQRRPPPPPHELLREGMDSEEEMEEMTTSDDEPRNVYLDALEESINSEAQEVKIDE